MGEKFKLFLLLLQWAQSQGLIQEQAKTSHTMV